jgi:sugar lactone lactonase YvrE
VRKFEPKPIRAYLTTGTNDMENCAGNWFLLDQEMDRALAFSGYDYFFRILNGGHVAGWNEYFPEAMRFLWKGWPAPVKAGAGAPRVQDVLIAGKPWELAAQGCREMRSPAVNAKGEVFFLDAAENKIMRLGLDGRASVFFAGAERMDGLAAGARGELYSVSSQTGKIICFEQSGTSRIVMDGVPGEYIMAAPDGGLYVSSAGKAGSQVWFIKDGKKTCVDSGLKAATGLALRPDQWLLSVADGGSKWVYSYQVNADGALTNKERYFWLHVPDWEDDAGAESLCYSSEGQMFVATRAGIQICADDGPTQVIIPAPDRARVVGVCLGGANLDTLFAFSADKIWRRQVKSHATGAFAPWTKVNGSRL